jgi:putative transposase
MKRSHDGRDRRSSRLDGFDYRTPGAYFVTLCTHARDHLFGEVEDDEMVLNSSGRLLAHFWARTAGDGRLPPPWDFVVMPNHVHGVVWLPRIRPSVRWPIGVGARRPFDRDVVSVSDEVATERCPAAKMDASPLQRIDAEPRAKGSDPGSLGALVGAFKSMVTCKINRTRKTPGLPVWQRGYYERVIRNERELAAVRQYILDNPSRWPDDPNNLRV